VRILVTSTPGLGHIIPLVPLAQALIRQGHELQWATGADAHPTIERAGVPKVVAGLTSAERHAEYRARFPESQDLAPQDVPAFMFPRLFVDVTLPPMIESLGPIVRDWPPDLIVHEVGEFAAPIVAGALGICHVTQGFGARLRAERFPEVEEKLASHWHAAGLEPRPLGGVYDHLYLDIYPPSLDPGYTYEIATQHLSRPETIAEAYDGKLRDWFVRPDDRPIVYVTFGTVFNATAGAFDATIDTLKELDVRALVTVGPRGDVEAFGPLPDHVVVARYVPQHVTMTYADLVVSHAGSGTFLAALARGIPQLCLPQAADQFTNAAAGARAGAALQLAPQEADRVSIREAIEELLGTDSFGAQARRISDDIAAMPSSDDVAALLAERFASTAS
jgi:UDP:flavonoid glycosyltransferase YjiC (YdhE family)